MSTKLPDLTSLSSLSDTDLVYVVDVSDMSDALDGSSKRVTLSDLSSYTTAKVWPRTAAEISAGVTPTNYRYEPGNAFRYGTLGTANDTTVLQTWLDCGEKDLTLPGGTYITTGIILAASSGVGSIRGIGMPVLKRHGAISGGLNDTILEIRSNKCKLDGIAFDGLGTTISPADPTLYVDLAMTNNVGSGDNTDVQSNQATFITNCFFYDAPGSCIAGAGMQSAIVDGNKFENWQDHAVYMSGDSGTGAGLGADTIVSNNIFYHSGSVSNGAVKCRNNTKRFIVSNNIFNIGDERAIDIHGGVGGTDFVPLDVVIEGNTGSCGIFAGIFSNTSSTQDESAHFLFADNNMRCSDRVFYLGDDATHEFMGDLQIIGGSYHNTSGSFKAFLDCRFFDNASEVRITLKGVKAKHYALMQGYYPNYFTVKGCTFDQTYASWVTYLSNTDDASAKTVIIEGNEFLRDTSGQGIFDVNVNDSSSVYIRNNYYKNSTNLCQLRDLPLLLVVTGNTCEDSSGVEIADGVTVRTSPDGVIILHANRMVSTAGSSTVPRLLEETITTSGTALLNSYTIIATENFFLDVSGGFASNGSGVTGFSGSTIFYTHKNYGINSSFAISYPSANRSSFLPSLQGIQEYVITNESADRSFDADTVAVAELADIVATLIKDLGHGT